MGAGAALRHLRTRRLVDFFAVFAGAGVFRIAFFFTGAFTA
jgi:hypothetical protein